MLCKSAKHYFLVFIVSKPEYWILDTVPLKENSCLRAYSKFLKEKARNEDKRIRIMPGMKFSALGENKSLENIVKLQCMDYEICSMKLRRIGRMR
jgi:hypothetical protein